MARSNPAIFEGRFTLTSFAVRQAKALAGLGILLSLALAVVALSTWNIADPSLSYATANPPTNLLGRGGALFADLMMQFFGLAAVIALLPILGWALILVLNRPVYRIASRIAAWFGGSTLASAALACLPAPPTWPLPNGIGGVFGDMILKFPALFIGAYPTGTAAAAIGTILTMPTLWLMAYSANLVSRDMPPVVEKPAKPAAGQTRPVVEEEDSEDDESRFSVLMGAVAHNWYTIGARLRRLTGMNAKRKVEHGFDEPYDLNDEEFGLLNGPAHEPGMRIEPSLSDVDRTERTGRQMVSPPSMHSDHFDDDDSDELPAGILPDIDQSGNDWSIQPEAKAQVVRRPVEPVAITPAAPRPQARPQSERPPVMRNKGQFVLPDTALMAEPKSIAKDASLSKEQLEQNARMLEGVLEDFGVKGDIIHVRPGPVVTLYELEPAPGIKSSRVIGLADDIARSMSAIAARVAVVPGRNAIGIELPNRSRETVFLREMIESRDFGGSKGKLALTLGKTIGGEPVIADLAKMPHLLVAGTTGSGKSVAINTMILSMLYRLSPEQCRLIMIDPKMLELSIYDGIPHLLTPVVTDPKKAVVALKWTVREMEERYKKMSKIGVRNIDGFNSRVEQARQGRGPHPHRADRL